MKRIVYILAILAASVALGGAEALLCVPAKSGGGWVNPYVTDGLVAMWDGEWNAGGGIHDPNLGKMVNLTGDSSLDMDISELELGNNYLHSSGGKNATTIATIPVGTTTMEVVGNRGAGSTWYYDETLVYLVKPWLSIGFGKNYNSCLFSYFLNANMNGVSRVDLQSYTVATHFSGIMNFQNFSKRFFVNGKEYNLPNAFYSSQRDFSKPSEVKIGSKTESHLYIYTARIYNRVLRDDEIRQNYRVDKVRFNLQ